MTAFDRRVYTAVRRIPAGRVASYGWVAQQIGCGSARAVGQALKRNPVAPMVPCHRVIAADGSLGGFEGRKDGAAVMKKEQLLAEEGVFFSGGRLRDPWRLLRAT